MPPNYYGKSGSAYVELLSTRMVYNHRGGLSAPSVAIYSPPLARLIDSLSPARLQQATAEAEKLSLARQLCVLAAKVYTTETQRLDEAKTVMEKMFPGFVRTHQFELSEKAARLDGAIQPPSEWRHEVDIWLAVPPLGIEEWKVDIGLTSNAEAQAAACYCKVVLDEKVRTLGPSKAKVNLTAHSVQGHRWADMRPMRHTHLPRPAAPNIRCSLHRNRHHRADR